MKTEALLYILAGLSVLVSCNKMSPAEQGADDKPGTTKILSLTAESEDMKTTLEKGSGNYRILWDSDDKIDLTDDTRTGTYKIGTRSADYRTATFEHEKGSSSFGSGVKAFFPAGLDYTWPARQTISAHTTGLSAEYGYTLDSYRTVSPLYGTVEGSRVLFKTLGSVLRIELKNNGEETFTVSYVKVSADQPLSGKFEIENGVAKILPVTSGNISLENFNKTSMEPGEGQIILDCGNPGVTVASGDMAVFNIAVPAINPVTNCKILFVDESHGKTVKLTASSTRFPYNNVARITATRTPSSEPGSNCFIVEPDSIDPIYITQMGKVPDTPTNNNGYCIDWQSLTDGGVNGCKIVWQTKNTTEEIQPASKTIISSVSYSSGVLTVVPTGIPGNALVAVTDDENGNGNIVWSYHIWVPETPINSISANGVTFLDRNLGALDVTGDKALGMQYQWGRKDPLLGFCTIENIGTYMMNGINDVSQSNHQVKEGYIDRLGDRSGSISLSISRPGLIIHKSQGGWCGSNNLYKLWGFGNASNSDGSETKFNKTIYDPCPSGYRVASVKNFKDAFENTNINKSNSMCEIGNIMFPSVGKLHHSGQANETSYYQDSPTSTGYGVWTAVKRKIGDDSLTWNLNLSRSTILFGNGSNGDYAAECYNVRCVKE